MTWLRGRRRRDERGVIAAELVLLATLLMAFVTTVVGGARFADARGQVNDAAYAAARAAALTTSFATGQAEGRSAAQQSLAQRGKACVSLEVSFAGTDWSNGGHVQATVTCHADLSDVVGFGLPGSRAFVARAVVPLETHRLIS